MGTGYQYAWCITQKVTMSDRLCDCSESGHVLTQPARVIFEF